MKINSLILIIIFYTAMIARGQTTINGLIRSAENNKPLDGVTIQVKGTRLGTISNEKGRFSIVTRGNTATLTISLLGFQKTEFSVVALRDTFIQVNLVPDITQLQEIQVSTGYQTLPKERATGSFSLVDRRTLENQVSSDVLSRLEATVNGLTVDRTTSVTGQITVRGLSTIQGPRAPLIVVDNFPYDGDINNINPNDIESVTVLKDAAAASIWGAKAGNGVIVLTTRKAKYNQPVTIDFNAFVSTGGKPDLGYIKQMSSSDFIDVEQQLYSKGFYNDWINSTNHRVLSDVIEILRKRDQGIISASTAANQIDRFRTIDVRNDFSKYVYQKQFNQQYSLMVQGGAATNNWTASTGYDNDLSNLDAQYSRINARFQDVFHPIKNLQLQAAIYYTRTNTLAGRPGYGNISQYNNGTLPYTQLADDQGNPLTIPKTYSASYLASLSGKGLLDWSYTPLTEQNANRQTGLQQDIVLNTELNYKLPFGFNIDFKYQYEYQTNETRLLRNSDSFYARDLVNTFSQTATATTVNRIIPAGGILDNNHNDVTANNIRGQLNYNHVWDKHELTALLGSELRRNLQTGYSGRLYGYNDDILTYGLVDYKNAYPNYVTGSTNYVPDGSSQTNIHTNYVSSFANAAYTYNDKYAFSVSARRDASNLFGLNTNDQWNPFYSAGLSWLASNEKFIAISWLNYLKLRLTYGISGNINPAMSAVTTIQYASTSPYTGVPYSRFINYFNPDLKWETSKMVNMGMDFKIFGERINGSIEYFHKNGENLFGTAVVDYTTGIGRTITKNVASMKGNGIDLDLQVKIISNSFLWNTKLNLSYYKDEVTDYYLSSSQGANFVGSANVISGIVGKPVYGVFAYRWAGLNPATGDPRGYYQGNISQDYANITGSGTTINDLQYFGSAIPTWYGSFNHTFGYKHIALDLSFVYKFGYYFRRNSISYTNLYNLWQGHSDFALRWQKPGDETVTNVPSAIYPAVSARDDFYLGSAPLVDKGDNIRLQYVNLSYQLTKKQWPKMPFKSLTVYFNASNLGIIWRANKDGIDPDYNYFSYSLPNTSVFALGLRANIN